MEAFNEVTKKTYKEQAIFYLNAFWPDEFEKSEAARDAIYKGWQGFLETDKLQWEEVNKKIWKQGWTEGNSLDELFSHKYLEKIGRTITVVAFRTEFRKIDVNFDKRMAMIEYLLFEHKHSVAELMDKPQGDNSKELDDATAQLAAVQQALTELQEKNERQKELVTKQLAAEASAQTALEQSTSAQAKADEALSSQRVAEAQVKAAEAALAAAVADLKRQEDEYKAKINALESKAHDAALGIVAKNKAANELAQLKGQDPLPLRKAKLTQEAALHAVEKERKASEAATERATQDAHKAAEAKSNAETAARQAEAARLDSEEQARQIEAAVIDTLQKFQAAKEKVEEMKKKSGSRQGSIWWLSRDLAEAGKFLPKQSGGFS